MSARLRQLVLNRLFTIKADAVFPRHRWNPPRRQTLPQQDLQYGAGGMA